MLLNKKLVDRNLNRVAVYSTDLRFYILEVGGKVDCIAGLMPIVPTLCNLELKMGYKLSILVKKKGRGSPIFVSVTKNKVLNVANSCLFNILSLVTQ